jgi:hypothetical protein
MSAGPNEQARPGCLLCLLQTSASMCQEMDWKGKTGPKLIIASLFLDRVIDALLDPDHTWARTLHLAVLGYSARPLAAPVFTSLLPGPANEPFLRTLAELFAHDPPSSKLGIREWLDEQRMEDAALAGPAAPAGPALAYAYHLVQGWMARHPDGWPPVVLHCGDDGGYEDVHALACASLPLLTAPTGHVGVAHCAYSDTYPGDGWATRPAAEGGRLWQYLWSASSPLPLEPNAPGPVRALAINTDPWPIVKRLLLAPRAPVGLPVEPPDTEGASVPPLEWSVRALWYVKKGNAESEWEDCYASAADRPVFAVSDGASEGIFARAWARLLAESFVREVPELSQAESREAWLGACRAVWNEQINYPSLRWTQQNKVNQTGAGATLVTLKLGPPARAGLPWQWQAWAIGDSCLFWVRDNALVAAFPVVASAHFALGPPLLRTRPDVPAPPPVCAAGECQDGDLFVLATDAVAQCLLRQFEDGALIDWGRLLDVEETAWREQIDAWRQEQRIVNDDCALLLVRVGGAGR